jgi:hypothetical protein
MNRIQTLTSKAAILTLLAVPFLAHAQETTPAATQIAPATATPLTKRELKDQRKQQKREERAANAQTRSAKSDAKSLKAQNKATQDKEKATAAISVAKPTP